MDTPADPDPPASDPDTRLRDVIAAMPEGVAMFDARDRFVCWNVQFLAYYPGSEASIRVGLPFEAFLRAAVARGNVPSACGDPEPWIAERMARHRLPESVYEHQVANGRWLRVREARLPDGTSIGVRTDITSLRERETSFRLLFDDNPVPMTVVDRETLHYLAVNDAALTLFGYGRDAFLRMTALDVRPERERTRFEELRAAGKFRNYAGERVWTYSGAGGDELSIVPHTRSITFGGRHAELVAMFDVTERLAAERELGRTRAFLNSVVDNIPVAVFVKDLRHDGRYLLYNKAGAALAGRRPEELLGRVDRDLFAPSEAERYRDEDLHALGSGSELLVEGDRPCAGGQRYLRTKKVAIPNPEGGSPHIVLGISEDVTERRTLELRLAHLAHYDALTALPNRLLFIQALGDALQAASDEGEVALFYIDLDHFKTANDAFGHRTGDALLGAVGQRLAAAVAEGGVACRLGGDEFALACPGVRGADEAAERASGLIAKLSAPYVIEGADIVIGASVGVALARPGEGAPDPDALLRDADTALYRAKATMRGSFQIYRPEMDRAAQARQALIADLRNALGRREFEIHFQPCVALPGGRVQGFEALLRWVHPRRGMVSPIEFVPVAEETGSIVAIGEWVLDEACREAARWDAPLRVAVNLSAAQFKREGLVRAVAAALARSGLDPHRLELEITESVALLDNETNLAILHELRDMGVAIALDDFGTGYSSLSFLRAFPFDRIKIDRSFVRDLGTSRDSLAIVRAVTRLAADLGMATTAEGVETREQTRILLAEGCGSAQGYLFGRPEPASRIARWTTRLNEDDRPDAAPSLRQAS